jgi:Transposase domain (DUF772)
MIRTLIIGYVFALRSERALCREVQVDFAYRWVCAKRIKYAEQDRLSAHAPSRTTSAPRAPAPCQLQYQAGNRCRHGVKAPPRQNSNNHSKIIKALLSAMR